MAGRIPDIEALTPRELKALLLRLLERVAALEQENAALRDEIARLKGLKGRPKFQPSGMETATEPKSARAGREKRRRGGKIAKLAIDDERVIETQAPADWRFKGYESYVVQDLILRACVVRFGANAG